MPFESVSPLLSAGAGRWQDWMWPDPILTTLSSSPVTTIRDRLTNTSQPVVAGNFGSGGAGVLGPSYDTALGCATVRLFGGGADGAGQIMRVTPAPLVLGRLAKNAVPAIYDDVGAWRVWANMAWTAPIAGTVDNGLQIVQAATPLIATPTPGFGINRSGAGRMALITVDATNVLRSTNLTGPGTTLPAFDETQLHAYELQIISATIDADASLRVLIDGALVASRAWGPGTFLPIGVAAQLGFFVQLFMLSANSRLSVQSLRMVSGPNLLNTF